LATDPGGTPRRKRTERQEGGIIIPDTAKEKPMESMVVAVGAGKTGTMARKYFLEVKKGDVCSSASTGGTESN